MTTLGICPQKQQKNLHLQTQSFFFSETFAETLPQLLVLYTLKNSNIIDDGGFVRSTGISIWLIKLYLSMLSSSFGMAKFLQLGPCQLIPQNKMGIGMFLITIANFFGLLWKIFSITGLIFNICIPTVFMFVFQCWSRSYVVLFHWAGLVSVFWGHWVRRIPWAFIIIWSP